MKKKLDEEKLSPVESVLADAQSAKHVVCIALDEGGEVQVLTTIDYMPDVLWAIELARAQVLDTSTEHDG
jgi:hypothetical protein